MTEETKPDIEAQAEAAAEAEKADAAEQEAKAENEAAVAAQVDEAKAQVDEKAEADKAAAEAEAKPPAKKKRPRRKAADKNPESDTAAHNHVKKRAETAKAIAKSLEDPDAVAEGKAKLEAEQAERREAIGPLVDKMRDLVDGVVAGDEDATAEYSEAMAELQQIAQRDDLDPMHAELGDSIAEAQTRIDCLQRLYADVQKATRGDDGRSHAERLADIRKASKAIKEQRVADRLKIQAKAAGMSPLDRHYADRPRASVRDAEASNGS